MEALLGENEMLQGKLHSQEDDFRLQNSTLMQELSKVSRHGVSVLICVFFFFLLFLHIFFMGLQLCSQIEQLEVENQQLKEESRSPDGIPGITEGEIRRLQAENTALQRTIGCMKYRA